VLEETTPNRRRPMLPHALRDTLTFILAGGEGGRLKPLTERRAKPAVPFGGAYRIIDFTLSNCIHSGLRRIYVLTQYQALSLEEHVRYAWNFLPRRLLQFISVRAPHHLVTARWYAGTADAIYHNIDSIREEAPERVLILSGDHIYKMDYRRMVEEHIAHGATATIGAVKIPAAESSRFGIFETDAAGRVLSFDEKPPQGKELPGEPGWCLGSMGIYLFETEALVRHLKEDAARGSESSHDFGRDVIPRMIADSDVYAHHFRSVGQAEEDKGTPYWRDVGTLDAYYEANLDLCSVEPKFNLYDTDWPIYTLWHNDPPAKTVLDEGGRRAEVVDSLLCPGVIVSGGNVRRSILGNRVFVDEGAVIEDSIILDGVVVKPGAKIRRAIIDKWNVIPAGETVGHDLDLDRQRYRVTESGIVVIPRTKDVIRD
jgi:glucose-1-phosphate adenylyltransferase